MQPIIWNLTGPNRGCVAGGQRLGIPSFLYGFIPLPTLRIYISGVTKDSTGAVLGSCVVHLFRTSGDLEIDMTTSDASTGAYSFSGVGLGETYYVVAYKAGSPDVAGTTVNTLIGA
jgi:hypothetical protein